MAMVHHRFCKLQSLVAGQLKHLARQAIGKHAIGAGIKIHVGYFSYTFKIKGIIRFKSSDHHWPQTFGKIFHLINSNQFYIKILIHPSIRLSVFDLSFKNKIIKGCNESTFFGTTAINASLNLIFIEKVEQAHLHP